MATAFKKVPLPRQNLFRQLAASLELDCRQAPAAGIKKRKEKFLGDAEVLDPERSGGHPPKLISYDKNDA